MFQIILEVNIAPNQNIQENMLRDLGFCEQLKLLCSFTLAYVNSIGLLYSVHFRCPSVW